MNFKLFSLLAVAAGVLMIPASLDAHHGQAGYNVKEPVTVSGTVTDFRFLNPHCIVEFEVKDDKGQVEKWQGELTSPNHLIRAGWTAASLKAGDQVTVTGYRAKSGAPSVWITKILLNGAEMQLREE